MITAEAAKALYEDGWAIDDPTLEELSKYIEDGVKLGRYTFVAFYDSNKARDEAEEALAAAGWNVSRYNGGDGLEIEW